jgi:hypothetical protein
VLSELLLRIHGYLVMGLRLIVRMGRIDSCGIYLSLSHRGRNKVLLLLLLVLLLELLLVLKRF